MDYRAIFESAPVGIFRIGADGKLHNVNQSMARICGYDSPQEMVLEAGQFERQVIVDERRWRELLRDLPDPGFKCGIEVEVYLRSGETKWVQMSLWTICQDGKIVHYEGTAEDITIRKTAEDKVKLLAYRDSVTGLPNRSWFEERLSQAVEAARWNDQRLVLLLLEVSRFNWIDDSYGKAVVDGLLEQVAERIRSALEDSATVARLEGARFAILIEGTRQVRNAAAIAEKVLAALSAQFSYLGHSFNLSPAMGASIFPAHGKDDHSLMSRADLAMYSARESGCNGIRFFSDEMEYRFRERARIETSLMLALERQEFSLVYQPQVDTRTGGISGLEALLRWQHPELGPISPGQFISVAESSGLIVYIGEWVLRTACMQARQWQEAGLPAVPMAVNVSGVQLRHQGFCEMVRRVLQQTRLDPKYLELELTEGDLLKNSDVLAVFQELREMGVALTIDDFGTGYSSFTYLRQFKVNRLKIDGSFVRECPENADDVAITTAILNMARALHMDVLAEGVENARQLDFLRTQNCYGVQGFYISNPVAAEQIYEKFQSALIRCA